MLHEKVNKNYCIFSCYSFNHLLLLCNFLAIRYRYRFAVLALVFSKSTGFVNYAVGACSQDSTLEFRLKTSSEQDSQTRFGS